MSSATGVKVLFLSPAVIYPVALVLMAVHGWWTDNSEAVFAAPITALLFALVEYPIAVVALWTVRRVCHSWSAKFQVVVSVALALAIHFTLIWPLGLFRFSGIFTSLVVGLTALSWATVAAKGYRRMTAAADCRKARNVSRK